MKRFNKNIITFILVLIIVIIGLSSTGVLTYLKSGLIDTAEYMKENGFFQGVGRLSWRVETAFSEGLKYHKDFLNLNSSVQNNMGTVLIDKGDTTVVKSKTGYLSFLRDEIPLKVLKRRAKNISKIAKATKESGSEFLYVMAPVKGYNIDYAENIEDFNKYNCDTFIEELSKNGVSNFSLISEMEKEGITEEEMFFITDHHWKPEYALWAVNKVSEELNRRYGYEYDKEKINIDNYNITVYEDWFLGSQGKKAGIHFTELGVDDISLITPKYETSLVNTVVGAESTNATQGSFEEVLLHKWHIDTKDYYNRNPYATYLGGDNHQQIIKNNYNKDGKTVLIIKDSFSCAFAPFFSMLNYKTYLLDLRNFPEFNGERIDVKDYIERIEPDYVIMMYTGVTEENLVYQFE